MNKHPSCQNNCKGEKTESKHKIQYTELQVIILQNQLTKSNAKIGNKGETIMFK